MQVALIDIEDEIDRSQPHRPVDHMAKQSPLSKSNYVHILAQNIIYPQWKQAKLELGFVDANFGQLLFNLLGTNQLVDGLKYQLFMTSANENAPRVILNVQTFC